MNAWLWFVIAAVAGVAGVSLLMLDRSQRSSHSRERRRWAALRGWQFADLDAALPRRWEHGALGKGGTAPALDLVTGSLFTAAGRRLVHVFDHVPPAGAPAVIAAVHRSVPQAVVLELWLPTVEFPADAELDLLGPVGDRYAFTSDVSGARPFITPELVALADDVGDDVPVMWIEDAWVAAAVAPNTAPSRLERLLRLLGDVADVVDGVHGDPADTVVVAEIRPDDPADDDGTGDTSEADAEAAKVAATAATVGAVGVSAAWPDDDADAEDTEDPRVVAARAERVDAVAAGPSEVVDAEPVEEDRPRPAAAGASGASGMTG
ncbi:MAG TPA: hypothetical protein VGD67_25965, partial [Pseudonocardiaceae bacterium]